jgi:hypothetical protein
MTFFKTDANVSKESIKSKILVGVLKTTDDKSRVKRADQIVPD